MGAVERPETTDSRSRESAEGGAATRSRWFPFRWVWPQRSVVDDDEKVRLWKRAWVSGAEARWAEAPATVTPTPADSPQAAAWRAGWHWADQQPDRRRQVRFAHPRRRTTDGTSVLRRRASAGAVGLSLLALFGWFWQRRRDS